MPPEATITACARRLKSPVTCRDELLCRARHCRREDRAADAVDGAVGDAERIDAVAEFEGQPAAGLRLARPPLERLDDAGAGAPADMKPRHRIAVAHRVIAAALGPADHRENAVAHRAQPVALFAGGERHIGFGPAPRPVILVAVEAGRPHPVLQREVETVLDAEPALFGAVDQEQAAERPERLAAEALFALLVDHDDAFAGVGDFGCRDEARKARRRPRLRPHPRAIASFPRSRAIEARAP